MSKIRHTLQLLHGGTLSTRQIGAALGISKSTVSEIASYARVAGVDWALAQTLSLKPAVTSSPTALPEGLADQ